MSQLLVISESMLQGWDRAFLERKFLEQGIRTEQISWIVLEKMHFTGPGDITILLGETCLRALNKQSIDKWQASIIRTEYGTHIPCYDMKRVNKDFTLQVWVSICAQKAARLLRGEIKEKKYDFKLNPPLEETINFLDTEIPRASAISVDIETGRGHINTVGFAISGETAIAVNVLPDRLSTASFKRLWNSITRIVESEQPKILQNFIYEHLYFSRYGIRLNSVVHDTMVANKFLWPELEMGLDSVGRIYTDIPYWKDDGKSWNNIRDWEAHYRYNCTDTVGTYQGYEGQRRDLKERGLDRLHDEYLTKLYPAIAEMCSRGIPLSPRLLGELRVKTVAEYESALRDFHSDPNARTVNPKSPAQVQKYLSAKGYQIPKKYDSKTKTYKASTDEKSLKKLRLKHTEDKSLDSLLTLSKLGKAISSYLSFTYHDDCRMRFSLNAAGTETMRFAGHCDPWDNGVNPQTVPAGNKGINVRNVFEAPPGRELLEIDLRQAESRFVAYDSADLNLIQTLEDPARDIHWEVAEKILESLGKSGIVRDSKEGKFWRQLGKKSGHGANYSMKEATFIDSCLSEMNIVLTKPEATKILEAYHQLYPGIRRWHSALRQELCQQRRLKTPAGWERYFYGRMDDDTFRQAYAFRPQSTIPFVVNKLMLHLMELRSAGLLNFSLLLQCHDSLLLELAEGTADSVIQAAEKSDHWHPIIDLPGGRLRIPIESKVGRIWGSLKVTNGGNHGKEETNSEKRKAQETQISGHVPV